MTKIWIAILAFAACSKQARNDCESAVSGAIDRIAAEQKQIYANLAPELRQKFDAETGAIYPKLEAALTKVCKEDRWPAETLACLNRGKTQEDFDRCDDNLTDEQRLHWHFAVANVIGSTPVTTPPTSGDTTGSAPALGSSAR